MASWLRAARVLYLKQLRGVPLTAALLHLYCCRTSRGFSIKQLTFDGSSGKLVESRVNRQMTAEEQQTLLTPGTK
jgi:hypothetical protein